ncbi:unnamed protein product [Euphydryas editha]|uniref:Uncharacterized protein n=1 Tax=Euphydryas editha TaxID=104508 RepID=A0AAU9ULG9_EUPED|nr:unnamed protein product [Euphydryas editha]
MAPMVRCALALASRSLAVARNSWTRLSLTRLLRVNHEEATEIASHIQLDRSQPGNGGGLFYLFIRVEASRQHKRSVGRSAARWTNDLRKIIGGGWMRVADKRDIWREFWEAYVQQ